jgi:hypothetical protein
MLPSRPCQRTRLAAGPIATIESCSCSMIHLTVGATTIRFTRDAFEGLADVVLAAAAELAVPPSADHSLLLRARGEA